MRHIAMVTGASSGVGKEFVDQFAHGAGGPLDEIWVIARRKEILDELATQFPGAHIRALPLDLTDPASYETLAQELEKDDSVVEWLVNCAGFGTFGTFANMERTSLANMVQLNCIAVIEMCSLALPHMVAGSRIVNLASIAGIVPQPYLSVYSATKAFVYELSRMLDHELKGTGIHVTAVCPKFMRTGFLDKPGDQQAASQMTRIGFADVRTVVHKSIGAAILGRPAYVPGIDMRLSALTARLLPRRALFKLEDLLFR